MMKNKWRSTSTVFAIGALGLALTYDINRGGSTLLSIAILALLGAIAGYISIRLRLEAKPALTAFVLGAAASEAIVFAHYYFSYGYQDQKFSVGVAVSVIEFVVIAAVGSFCLRLVLSRKKNRG